MVRWEGDRGRKFRLEKHSSNTYVRQHEALCSSYCRILKGNLVFLIVFHGKFDSISYRFRDKEVFPKQKWRHADMFAISNRFQVIPFFHLVCDFSTSDKHSVVLGENDPQELRILKNTCLVALPCVIPRLLSHCAWNRITGLGCTPCKETNNKQTKLKLKLKVTGPEYVTTTWSRYRWSDPKTFGRVGEPWNVTVTTHAKFEVNRY